jgi:hypothetical protein
MPRKVVTGVLLAVVLMLVTILPGSAGSTTKGLSTNFTLINLGDGKATGTVQYVTPEGTQWKPDDSFTIDNAGGQAIFRQYLDSALPDGRGSVVISADQSLGAVVQILARNQTPTSGAYVGFNDGSDKFYVPLAVHNLSGVSGLANSQIVIQNTGSGATDVAVDLVGSGASSPATYTKSITGLAQNAAYLYDLQAETNLSDGWYGSAVVRTTTAGGKVVVVSNLFTGPNGMQTFGGFSAPQTQWLVPLFASRLANGVSTPLTVQNLSGGEIATNGITVSCTKNPNGPNPATLTIQNPSAVADKASFNINPVTDMSLPAGWYGSCRVDSGAAGVVAFVQMRKIGTDQAAAYEAIPANSTDKKVLVPLAAKRLGNQFATVTTIQNLNAGAAAHVTFTYIPSPEYIAGGGSSGNVVIPNVEIPAGASVQNNLRLASGPAAVPQLPDGWYGTCVVESTDQAISGIVELTFLTGAGDTWQAHNVFTKP